ncbi:MAG: hypothetical protein DBX67_06915 [Desulfovibrionaceae bacterium]|nr:MAG: hypothetical protein DBX67_06915 [Desulfovibrionaceae bacterium]
MGMNDRNLAQRVGAAIAARRKQRGYTQSQLAERLSISQEALSRMEKGIISPKFSRLEDLADALGCTVAELFHAPSDTTRARGMTLADIIRPLSPKSQDAVVDLISLMVQTFEIQYRYGIFDQHASADRKLERSDGPPPRFPAADMRPPFRFVGTSGLWRRSTHFRRPGLKREKLLTVGALPVIVRTGPRHARNPESRNFPGPARRRVARAGRPFALRVRTGPYCRSPQPARAE